MNQWYYARGGSQQGPVTLAALKALIQSGGLDPATDLVWNPSMKDWLPAHQVRELATGSPAAISPPAPTTDPGNPYAAPSSAWVPPSQPEGPLVEIPPGSEPIIATACVKRGFDLTVRHFGMILLVGVVYIAVSIGASILFSLIDTALGWGPPANPAPPPDEFTFQSGFQYGIHISGHSPVESILSQVVGIFLTLGATRIGLNIIDGKPFNIGMLFGGGQMLLRAIGASILFWLMVVVGLLLLIVPGIYLMLRYGQFMYAIVDRDLGVIDSLKYSSTLTTNNRGNLFLLVLLSIGILIAGLLAFCVGLIFAWPVFWLSWIVAFRWMQYGSRSAMDHPHTRPMLDFTD